jgi:hypothetical protein
VNDVKSGEERMMRIPFGNAVHGSWCGARTYPIRCGHCGQQVFYFSCNCGSKVFFEALGDPWPIHERHAEELLEGLIVNPAESMEIEVVGEIRHFAVTDVASCFNLDPNSALTMEILRRAQLSDREFLRVAINEHTEHGIHIYNFLVEQEIWALLGDVRIGDSRRFDLGVESLPLVNLPYWLCYDLQ